MPDRTRPLPQGPILLVIGSLHYDIMVETDHLPRRDETAIGHRWFPKFGGKGGNQAVAIALAGGQPRMVGALGDDAFGDHIRQDLRAAGVDARWVATVDNANTGMSVAITDRAGDYAATVVSGANQRIDPGAVLGDALWDGVVLLVLQNEVPEAVNRAAAKAARTRGVPVLLNAAPTRALPRDLRGLIDILVVNAVEAEMMGAGAVTDLASAAEAARKLAHDYPSVVVTAGAAGLAAADATAEPVRVPALEVDVVSTHGAGDVFIGTLAVGLARDAVLEDACRIATRAAARHVAGETGGTG